MENKEIGMITSEAVQGRVRDRAVRERTDSTNSPSQAFADVFKQLLSGGGDVRGLIDTDLVSQLSSSIAEPPKEEKQYRETVTEDEANAVTKEPCGSERSDVHAVEDEEDEVKAVQTEFDDSDAAAQVVAQDDAKEVTQETEEVTQAVVEEEVSTTAERAVAVKDETEATVVSETNPQMTKASSDKGKEMPAQQQPLADQQLSAQEVDGAVKVGTEAVKQAKEVVTDVRAGEPEAKTGEPTRVTDQDEMLQPDLAKSAVAQAATDAADKKSDARVDTRNLVAQTVVPIAQTVSGDAAAQGGLEARGRSAVSGALMGAVSRTQDEPLKSSDSSRRMLPSSMQDKVLERIRQIVQVESASQGRNSNSLTIRLDPPELGSLSVKLTQRSDKLYARIVPENKEVEAALRHRAAELSHILSASGIRAENVHVSIGAERSGTEMFQFNEFLQQNGGSNQGAADQGRAEEGRGQHGSLWEGDLRDHEMRGVARQEYDISGWVA